MPSVHSTFLVRQSRCGRATRQPIEWAGANRKCAQYTIDIERRTLLHEGPGEGGWPRRQRKPGSFAFHAARLALGHTHTPAAMNLQQPRQPTPTGPAMWPLLRTSTSFPLISSTPLAAAAVYRDVPSPIHTTRMVSWLQGSLSYPSVSSIQPVLVRAGASNAPIWQRDLLLNLLGPRARIASPPSFSLQSIVGVERDSVTAIATAGRGVGKRCHLLARGSGVQPSTLTFP
jgi:hypothetical protein